MESSSRENHYTLWISLPPTVIASKAAEEIATIPSATTMVMAVPIAVPIPIAVSIAVPVVVPITVSIAVAPITASHSTTKIVCDSVVIIIMMVIIVT
ncbi:hypothetical protein ABIE66_001752 [Peribacillus sp. B2I2]|uniref:hypothetical protein n=1 Tax=Peribacillus sp. B2I2 TaxID=3156468 RepID=UPI0035189979